LSATDSGSSRIWLCEATLGGLRISGVDASETSLQHPGVQCCDHVTSPERWSGRPAGPKLSFRNAETAPSSLPANRSTPRSRSFRSTPTRSVPPPEGSGTTRNQPEPVGASPDGAPPGLATRPRPTGLDTSVSLADPLPLFRGNVVAVLPEHFSGPFPGSRHSSADAELALAPASGVGSVRFRIPSPCPAWGASCATAPTSSTCLGHFPRKNGDIPRIVR